MQATQQDGSRSTLLRAIGPEAFAYLSKHLQRVELPEGEPMATSGQATTAVYFPETVVASTVAINADGTFVEVGLAGHEGLVGWSILLGEVQSPFDVVAHAGGGALRVEAGAFVDVCRVYPCAAATFMRYVTSFTVQIGRTAVSNLRDPVERRLTRWLLMVHDRIEGDEIDLTHKAIAAMLGMRRASVTDGLHGLEGRNLIRNRRGRIVIRDREQLRQMAGDGYGQAEAHYSRSIAPFGK
jgi:CRP-like cAMP-binding protein